MENQEKSAFENFDTFNFDQGLIEIYSRTATWGKLLGVLGFVFSAAFGYGAFSVFQTGLRLRGFADASTVFTASGILFLILTAFTFFASLKLFAYGTNMTKALASNSQIEIKKASTHLLRAIQIAVFYGFFVILLYTLVFLSGAMRRF